MKIKRPKYGNKKTEYNGTLFHSKKEADYAKQLDLLKNCPDLSQQVSFYEMQVPYEIVVNGKKICKYILDFKVIYVSGRIEYVDVKGVKTAIYKLKAKLMKAVHGITITEK